MEYQESCCLCGLLVKKYLETKGKVICEECLSDIYKQAEENIRKNGGISPYKQIFKED